VSRFSNTPVRLPLASGEKLFLLGRLALSWQNLADSQMIHQASASPIKNKKSPLNFLRSNEDKLGDGSSPLSLSRADIGRQIGCQLPDAILHGKRSLRPRSRAVQRIAIGSLCRALKTLGGLQTCSISIFTSSLKSFLSKREQLLCALTFLPRPRAGNHERAHHERLFSALLQRGQNLRGCEIVKVQVGGEDWPRSAPPHPHPAGKPGCRR